MYLDSLVHPYTINMVQGTGDDASSRLETVMAQVIGHLETVIVQTTRACDLKTSGSISDSLVTWIMKMNHFSRLPKLV